MTRITKKTPELSNHQKRLSILDDIKRLTDAHNGLAQFVQRENDKFDERLDDVSVVLKAIATIIGEEKVADAARAIRIETSEKNVANQEAALQKQIDGGKIASVETVTPGLLVVTSIKRPDGTLFYPTKNFLPLEQYHQDVQPLLIGKKVGDIIEFNNNSVEVLGIYGEVNGEDAKQ
jgi:hypothetical protein